MWFLISVAAAQSVGGLLHFESGGLHVARASPDGQSAILANRNGEQIEVQVGCWFDVGSIRAYQVDRIAADKVWVRVVATKGDGRVRSRTEVVGVQPTRTLFGLNGDFAGGERPDGIDMPSAMADSLAGHGVEGWERAVVECKPDLPWCPMKLWYRDEETGQQLGKQLREARDWQVREVRSEITAMSGAACGGQPVWTSIVEATWTPFGNGPFAHDAAPGEWWRTTP